MPNLTYEQFSGYLRSALHYLYDPDQLRRSPLAGLLGVAERFDTPSALQRILSEAIEALKPSDEEPAQSRAWRIYDALVYRYLRRLEREAVADQLGISERQLQRELRAAVEALAAALWKQYDLEGKPAPAAGAVPAASGELAWLREAPETPTDLGRLLETVLGLARPLAQQFDVTLRWVTAGELPQLAVRQAALRHALLSLLSVAIPRTRGIENPSPGPSPAPCRTESTPARERGSALTPRSLLPAAGRPSPPTPLPAAGEGAHCPSARPSPAPGEPLSSAAPGRPSPPTPLPATEEGGHCSSARPSPALDESLSGTAPGRPSPPTPLPAAGEGGHCSSARPSPAPDESCSDTAPGRGWGGVHPPAGEVRLSAQLCGREVEIRVECPACLGASAVQTAGEQAALAMARELARLCSGRLTLGGDPAVFARLTLPVFEQVPVLAIDDNDDFLQLLQRYAAGTPYTVTGTQEPGKVLDLIARLAPQVILLDVMMPEVDGWAMLAELRQHPLAGGLPIVICSILPQEALARPLGANAFLRKPVSRHEFLRMLDEQVRARGMQLGARSTKVAKMREGHEGESAQMKGVSS